MLTYLRIIGYGRPYFWLGGLALLALLVYTLFSAASLVAIIPFLEILFETTPSPEPAGPLLWYDTGSLKDHGYYFLSQQMQALGKDTVLIYFCLGLSGAILIKNIARYLGSYCMSPLEEGIIQRLREHLFRHLTQLDLGFFTKHRKGDIITVQVSDTQVVSESVVSTIHSLLREPLTMLVFLGTMLFISWKLTLFTLIVLPITGLAINLIAKPLKGKAHQGQELLGRVVSMLDEFISGIRIVKAFQKEPFERDRFNAANRHYTRTQVWIRRRSELASPVTEVLSIAVVCVIIYYGGTMILGQQAELKPSEFMGFIAVFSQFLAPIKVFSSAISKIQKGIAAFQRIETQLALQPQIEERPGARAVDTFEQELRFEGVSFRYETEDVLQDISFSVKKGQMVALVGPSGAGKSTLADLIPRFYDPYQGRLTLDGHDLRDLRLSDLRALIGNVTQEGVLFHDSVLHNIAYGIPAPNREAVIAAAKVANAHEFIVHLPQGYDTVIGERGTMLSGGQRQRLAIARAVLRNPPILILDEATSSLDTQSEKLVQEALENLMQQRTSIVIAHRLSTVLRADKILTIERGRVVEQGTHPQLMATGGMYKRLYDLQFSGEQ
jgi:ATP-binding cassette, subfamily B, bacterial MsbA